MKRNRDIDEYSETAEVLKMMGGLELKRDKKPTLLKNRQVFDTDSISQLSEFNPFNDPLTLDINNRLERNSCCHCDEKSDNGLDSTKSFSVLDDD